MDIGTSSGSSPAKKPPEVGSSNGGCNGHASSPTRKAAAAEQAEQAVPAQGVPGRLPGFSSGDGDASSPIEEISSAGVVAGNGGGSVVIEGCMKTTPPSELPLLELEKQSTVDTLFELMESGQSVSVLVWDLLMKMPTNMRLFNGFLSIGLTTGPTIARQGHAAATAAVEGGPLSLLQDASSSRLLYSLMIVEHLLSRDMSTPLLVADVPPSGGNGGERSLEQQQHASGHDESNSVATAVRLAAIAAFTGGGGLTESATEIKPGMNGVAGQEPATATAGGGGDGNSDGDWEVYQPAAFGVGGGACGDFVAGCGGVDVGEVVNGGGAKIGRRTWRDRFVGSGGIDALVELVLTR
ncbi:unnamed protein product, partial [Ectocarpus sp. 8 AP-2014]